ncbi:MAG: hypothetical protein E6G56_14680 [Actinobacteria bacterium]|nr:MAG: hypothetical protein E6G56_14680 [Actinomycetota bacterium]
MSFRNTQVVGRAYEALNASDIDAALALAAPDVQWIPSEGSPFEGSYRGRERVKRFFQEEWVGVFDDLRMEVRRLVEAAEGVVVAVVHFTGRGRASGAELAIDIAHLWRLRDGVVVEVRVYPRPEDALQAAGLQE